ncbi:PepSY domain-containing protein [Sphingomonas sp. JC676]|uniref:PepSY domain-containing protein n=1 Tax=Sphingomonas sp. JC676 TaxID=2768065 RepID=UPI001657BD32|nr:PepSY domain-containing protein [Sphingomonas sp. JC676]MBC9033724.1 PepSY domain-containing protein [Sphingomonas sp. JC676]
MIDRTKAHAAALIGVVLAATLGAATASASDSQDKRTKEQRRAEEAQAIRTAVQRGEVIPLPRILALAQARVQGEVLEVELEHEQKRLLYEIKILAGNGRVRELKLDARTGALIKIEDD